MQAFVKTCENLCSRCAPWGLTALRIVLGIIFINHGYGKLFGDTSAALAFFESTVLPAPGIVLIVAGIIEFFGGLLLIAGFFTRTVAFIAGIEFIVIILFVKLGNGLTAMELDLLIFAVLFALSCTGAGKWAIDNHIIHRKTSGSDKAGHGSEAIAGQ